MIVGKESAGKTCLLRRLLKEGISDVSSTDGVDIVVRRCKINIENGKWTIGKRIKDDKFGRIKRAIIAEEKTTMDVTKGQKEFYATHQAFLTSSAVYLVVADMKDDISKQGLSQYFADFQHIGEYVDFWFDSIHCHRTTSKPASNGHFNPPILLVFTGKDKYNKAEFKKREKELNNQIDHVFGFQSKYHHLYNKFYLSNTKDSNEDFEKLQYAIYETARKMDNWGNAFPLKWILLEHLIEINKINGKNFINFPDMSNLAKHPDINILEKEELLLFLRFQHNVGNIIFFENIQDLIILRPQWLADAFRCLVSDKVDYRRLHHLKDWTLFTRQGKMSESLITELFNSKDGCQLSGQKK
ncbi:probable serine/threonine-protein kinase roco8 [Mytilus californianus]|uniref:probable serine/threonine-protein kinase roco8 n=1 Tax=Mytilus californianus TaxID=6549 RepID=UPI002245F66D|nr:probable serine/threonine-protein kinase roco8 [Mytilus californianus]